MHRYDARHTVPEPPTDDLGVDFSTKPHRRDSVAKIMQADGRKAGGFGKADEPQ
jgi:hypothetical protein